MIKSNDMKTRTTAAFLLIALGCLLTPLAALAYETSTAADGDYVISDEDQAKIISALPDTAPASPKQPRKLLIFDLNVVYGGHPSRFYANLAFQEMGKKTGAFEVVISRDPAVFEKENLSQFDAVFLNNTVGNQFTDPRLRQNLLEFVYGGGGLMGMHGTAVAFWNWDGGGDDWPEFGRMLGGRGAQHRDAQEKCFMKIDSPGHPLLASFPKEGFELSDEFFRVGDPYSRDRVRVLFSIDTEKTDLGAKTPEREDQDYAAAWVRHFGRGRVFYTSFGHNPYLFWDTAMLKFYLAATQFVLGDLDVPTIPSARLTPAIEAQEKLGWNLGIVAYTFHKYSLFETIEKTNELGLAYLGGLDFQKVGGGIDKNFNADLSDEELAAIRLKLDDAGVRMLTCFYSAIPGDEEGCRKVFEFARKMGIQTLISEPPLEALDTIEGFCNEYEIDLALHNHDQKASPNYSGHGPKCCQKNPRCCGNQCGYGTVKKNIGVVHRFPFHDSLHNRGGNMTSEKQRSQEFQYCGNHNRLFRCDRFCSHCRSHGVGHIVGTNGKRQRKSQSDSKNKQHHPPR